MDCSLAGSSAHGIFQARVLELGAIAFSCSEDFVFQSEMWRHGRFGSEEPCDPRQLYKVRVRDQREPLTHQKWLSLQLYTFVCVCVLNSSTVSDLYDPMDCSLPDSLVYEIFHTRTVEWVAISFSRGSSQPRDRTQVSCIEGRRFTIWATRGPS